MDQAEQIRRRLRELSEGTGFPASQVAEEMGPDAAEIEFADRFKQQMVARQAQQDQARAAADAKDASGRQRTARDAAATASPRDMMTELVPPGGLAEPRTNEARSQDDLEDPGDGLVLPDLAPPVAAPRDPVRPDLRTPRFNPPNPIQDRVDRTGANTRGAAAAAATSPPAAQMARDRQAQRDRASAPGGLNVPPARVAADREAAQGAARRPAPAQSGKAELLDRETRARESKEIQDYQFAVAQHDADMREWRTRLDEAYETGNDVLAQQLAANEPEPPEAPPSVTGGLESNEFRATFDHDSDPATPRIAETAEQTLARLQQTNPEAYRALQETGIRAVGADPKKLKEWFSNQFGDMDPSERYDTMVEGGGRLATSKPQLVVPRGSATGIGTPGRRPSAPLDYDESQLDPRTGKPVVTRDASNNARPETMPGGGRLATPGGKVTRAPEDSAALESMGVDINTFNPNPTRMTPEWRKQMLAIGMFAFGFDREAYAEGEAGDDQYIASVQKAMELHKEKMGVGYDTQRVVTGGTRYKPNKDMVDRRTKGKLDREVDQFVQSNPAGAAAVDPKTGTPYETLLLDAAAAGEANKVRDLMAAARREGRANRSSMLATNRSREADQQNRQNPRRAPGMFRDSLTEAGNDPRAIAAVYRDWGMPEEAERILAMANQRLSIETGGRVGLAQVEAGRERGPVEFLAGQDQQLLDGLLNPDATRPINDETAIKAYGDLHPDEDGTPLDRPAAMTGLARMIVRTGLPNAVAHPIVQGVLRSLFNPIWQELPGARADERQPQAWWDTKREFFQGQADTALGMDPETAGREFDRLQDDYESRRVGGPAAE